MTSVSLLTTLIQVEVGDLRESHLLVHSLDRRTC